MDQQELQKQIAIYYTKLPKEMQVFFAKQSWLEAIRQLSIKYELKEKEINILATETTLVLLGVIPIEEYELALLNGIKLDQEMKRKFLEEVNDKVLNQTRPSIKEVYNQNINEKTEEQVKVEKKLSEKFKTLPQVIQDAINESNYQQTLFDIAEEEGLSIVKLGQLEELTTEVMLGNIPAAEFENKVRLNLNLPNEKTLVVTKKINDRILRKIKDAMVGAKKDSPATDSQVLNKAGIKIITKPASEPTQETPKAPPLMSQKLSQPLQMSKAKTEYNLTQTPKEETGKDSSIRKIQPVDIKTTSPIIKSYQKGNDPYRLSPDE